MYVYMCSLELSSKYALEVLQLLHQRDSGLCILLAGENVARGRVWWEGRSGAEVDKERGRESESERGREKLRGGR